MTVNLWSEPEHAQSYLEHRKKIPRRAEGYAALLEFVPEHATRVLDLGCGDGTTALPAAKLGADVLGPVDIPLSQITAPTRNSMDANESAVFS